MKEEAYLTMVTTIILSRQTKGSQSHDPCHFDHTANKKSSALFLIVIKWARQDRTYVLGIEKRNFYEYPFLFYCNSFSSYQFNRVILKNPGSIYFWIELWLLRAAKLVFKQIPTTKKQWPVSVVSFLYNITNACPPLSLPNKLSTHFLEQCLLPRV